MNAFLPRTLFRTILLLLTLLASFIFSQYGSFVTALTPEQKQVIDSGVYYFNVENSTNTCQTGAAGALIASTLPDTVPEPHKTLFTQAAAKFGVNPQFLTAIFLSENGNVWKAFNTSWASSPVGASGPFQFMPATWSAYKTDGNNDGSADINNMYDAAYSAAKLLKGYNATANAPLGSIDKPFERNTLLQISASYNWGPGNVQSKTTPTSPLSVAPTETQEYISNIYALITSGFTKSGKPGYPDPAPTVSAGDPAAPPVTADGGASCLGNADAIAIADKAIELSWPESHGLEIKPEYAAAIREFNPTVRADGADCGMFVSTVMKASGADPDYPISGTSNQEAYVRAHPEKYDVVDSVASTADLLPGDILIVNQGAGAGAAGHTYIFVGSQPPNGYNEASASLDSRSANLGDAVLSDDRGAFIRARLK